MFCALGLHEQRQVRHHHGPEDRRPRVRLARGPDGSEAQDGDDSLCRTHARRYVLNVTALVLNLFKSAEHTL